MKIYHSKNFMIKINLSDIIAMWLNFIIVYLPHLMKVLEKKIYCTISFPMNFYFLLEAIHRDLTLIWLININKFTNKSWSKHKSNYLYRLYNNNHTNLTSLYIPI